MTAPHSTPRPEDTQRKTNLNLTQTIAGALAAVTAAVLGSGLGLGGTLVGAGAASVIVTVGTALYKASLEQGQNKIRSLARHTGSLPIFREGVRTGGSPPVADTSLSDGPDTSGPHHGSPDRSRLFARLRWGAVVVSVLGAFVLAMMVITGFEWASGETVGGNGQGTTLGRVVSVPSGPRTSSVPSAPHSSEAPTSEAPTDTSTAPDTTTSTSGEAPSVEQSPTTTSAVPAPSEPQPTPLLPTGLPGAGGGKFPQTAGPLGDAEPQDQAR